MRSFGFLVMMENCMEADTDGGGGEVVVVSLRTVTETTVKLGLWGR